MPYSFLPSPRTMTLPNYPSDRRQPFLRSHSSSIVSAMSIGAAPALWFVLPLIHELHDLAPTCSSTLAELVEDRGDRADAAQLEIDVRRVTSGTSMKIERSSLITGRRSERDQRPFAVAVRHAAHIERRATCRRAGALRNARRVAGDPVDLDLRDLPLPCARTSLPPCFTASRITRDDLVERRLDPVGGDDLLDEASSELVVAMIPLLSDRQSFRGTRGSRHDRSPPKSEPQPRPARSRCRVDTVELRDHADDRHPAQAARSRPGSCASASSAADGKPQITTPTTSQSARRAASTVSAVWFSVPSAGRATTTTGRPSARGEVGHRRVVVDRDEQAAGALDDDDVVVDARSSSKRPTIAAMSISLVGEIAQRPTARADPANATPV